MDHGLGLVVFLAGFRNPFLTEFFSSITVLGSMVFGVVLCGGLFILSREKGVMTFLGLILSATVTHSLKLIFSVPRPAVDRLVEVSTYSFPSGHTTVAFSLAVLLSDINEGLRNYLFGVAVLVGFSRIYLGVHYFTDVVAGAVIGYIVSKIFLEKFSDDIASKIKSFEQT